MYDFMACGGSMSVLTAAGLLSRNLSYYDKETPLLTMCPYNGTLNLKPLRP